MHLKNFDFIHVFPEMEMEEKIGNLGERARPEWCIRCADCWMKCEEVRCEPEAIFRRAVQARGRYINLLLK